MGFRALKEKQESKQKKVKNVLFLIGAIVTAGVVIFSCFVPPASWRYYFRKPNISKRKAGEMRIHFIDVGQGDSTLIELPDGKIALIDGGDEQDATKKTVMRYLNALDVDVIDHLIITHTDKDHCGALDEVFRYKKVLNAYLPHVFDDEDVEYAEAYAMAQEEGCEIIKHARNVPLSDDSAPYTFRFLYPCATEPLGYNSKDSAVLWLDYKGVSALFCGDADEYVEELLLRDDELGLLAPMGVALPSTEILKVAHHGSAGSSTSDFLLHLRVETAVISCGKDNQYGHPKEEVLERLRNVGAEIYRTDTQGSVVVTVKADGSYTTATVKE